MSNKIFNFNIIVYNFWNANQSYTLRKELPLKADLLNLILIVLCNARHLQNVQTYFKCVFV